ncbi:NPCBM/NEW2 domain-containing protein [Cellvibrio sp. pealriver]|uniref:NPCBM/NEW2 domain-containing protein n=1 Tax=Cellvibrio sp. pealriver TaxID=1622269 RepID=UPI00066FC38C|nr:NPCBM/NEW2 domain-containing protein [Cellvibrio sp. pealriver]
MNNSTDATDEVKTHSQLADTTAALTPETPQPAITFPEIKPLALGEANSNRYILHSYIVLAITANFLLLFLKGYSQDLGYWQDWVRQLSTTGYDGFNGNYPPFYIHWLYIVGQFYNVAGIPLEHNNFLKFLTQLPVNAFHCLLVVLVHSQLQRFRSPRHLTHTILLFTAINPAILVNGPIWGQVDLIPATMVFCALLLTTYQRYAYLAIPVFALSLLTKFQMIAFAPVFGFLFFCNIGKNILGIFISLLVGALVFMPSILAGHFWQSVSQAYIDTLGQYPMTTFNAANIWILLTGNVAPDSIILFGVAADSVFATIFTAKYFGMLLFSLTALAVFFQGIHFFIKNGSQISGRQLLSQAFFSATICALAFFALLPAMHERYLFPAVVMALAYSAVTQQKLLYPIVISLLCSLNMLIILEINGSDIWFGLAWGTMALLLIAIIDLLINGKAFHWLKKIALFTLKIPIVSLWFFLLTTVLMTKCFFDRFHIHEIELAENQIFLTALPLVYARQDHGTMALNRSFDGNHLSIANRRYAQGIGTHASSDIQYQLPPDAAEFSFIAALDDEVGTSDVQFSVWGDDKLLWESPPIFGYERTIPVTTIDVRNVQKLTLKVAPLKDDKWDHANWVNTVITITPKVTNQEQAAPVSE